MPLLYIERIDKRTQLGIWQFDDRTHIEDVCPPEVYNKIKTMCNNRQKETAAVYALLNEMLGRGGWTTDHEDSGRPILRDSGLEIGISHTNNYASLIISESKRVAVDIEHVSDRICKIEEKFMRSDELEYSHTLIKPANIPDNNHTNKACILLLFWCAKETMYKFYSDNHLALHDIKIEQIEEANSNNGSIRCCNMQNGDKKTIFYRIDKNTVLTYLA